ncbi:cilium assembly protein DZIP1L-like [Erinaceus europaeus]|uniref:Cilium assembly protein DZIP1L-like n=1 Tax=Erinaceus europaeus TaxID=9365 RepID=A0ABM3YAN3_ERIEU|nr:cilium assembly protein DZIP1L-like [Erinaceus europaeus]
MIHPNEPADLSSPPSEPSPPAAFQFAPRHGHVDWGRISALDVDRVVQEVDVGTLQEHMGDITLTNFEGKVCAHCAQPVAPELLKVLRLLQLNMEYLDHRHTCQRAMSRGLQAQLQASLAQQEQAQQKVQRQAAELQALKEENLLQREKISILQQILLYRDSEPFNTCTLCQKTFLDSTYLWIHIQRRHLYPSEKENQLKNEIKDLKQSLKKAQKELEAQKKEAQQQQQQRQRQRQRQVGLEGKHWVLSPCTATAMWCKCVPRTCILAQ